MATVHNHPRRPQIASDAERTCRALGDAAAMSERTAHLGGRPFRGSAAISRGLVTPGQLRTVAWRRLFRDVYVDARVPLTRRVRIQAAALRLPPDGVVTGRSAAYLWGAEFGRDDDPVEVITRSRLSAGGLRVRWGSVRPDEVTMRHGVRVPTIVHLTWELARTLPVLDAVPWIDRLAAIGSLSTTQLTAHATAHLPEWRSRSALPTLSLCDARAESPPESIVRVRLAIGGIDAPVPQFEVWHDGVFVARVDMAWPEIRLALEYDGQWHAGPDQLARDRERLRRLNAAGWYVYPITRNDLRNPDELVEKVRALIDRRRGLA
jgi:hypothetical protein